MKTYRVLTVIQGYRVGKEFGGKRMIAIPEKYRGQDILAICGGEQMILRDFPNGALAFRHQADKFTGGTFLLAYFEWLPEGVPAPKGQERTYAVVDEVAPVKRVPSNVDTTVLIKCPKCKGAMRRVKIKNITGDGSRNGVECIVCGHNL